MEGRATTPFDPKLLATLARALALAAVVVALLWFVSAALPAILLTLVAVVMAVVLNAPVTWLAERGMGRGWALALVLLAIVGLIALVIWLVVPRVASEWGGLVERLPGIADALETRFSALMALYPGNGGGLDGETLQQALPELRDALMRVGKITVGLFAGVVYLVLLLSMVVYMVASPRSLLVGYLALFPERLREKAARAFARSSRAIVGWVFSNAIVGAVQAIGVAIVLPLLGVPGALVWAVLAFFAELIPKAGPYLMTIPPVLVALAIDPILAFWVLVFYVVLQEVAGDVVGPYVRGRAMNLHPAGVIFAVIALFMAFGLLGALLAVPAVGIVKAYWGVFWLDGRADVQRDDKLIDGMLHGRDNGELAAT